MHHDLVDVLIIEDESELARLHAELVQNTTRLAGMAASSPRRGTTPVRAAGAAG
jgi:response regulator of citrate/malate metabolism